MGAAALVTAILGGVSAQADINVTGAGTIDARWGAVCFQCPTGEVQEDSHNSPVCHLSAGTNFHNVFEFEPGGTICGVTTTQPIYWTNDAYASARLDTRVSVVGDAMTVVASGDIGSLNTVPQAEIPCDSNYLGDSSGGATYLISFDLTNSAHFVLSGSLHSAISSISSVNGGNTLIEVSFSGGSNAPYAFYTNAVQLAPGPERTTDIFQSGTLSAGHYTFSLNASAVVRWSNPSTMDAGFSLSLRIGPKQVRLRALEVNQVVQDWSNSVPLIAGKPTIVRAFVQPVDPDDDGLGFQGQLRGYQSGSELSGSPLQTLNQDGIGVLRTNVTTDETRSGFASVNFQLPKSWAQQGVLTLKFETPGMILLCGPPDDPGGTAGDCTLNLVFAPSPNLPVKFVRVRYTELTTGLEFQPTEQMVDQMVTLLPQYLPVKDVEYVVGELEVPVDYIYRTEDLLVALQDLRQEEKRRNPNVPFFYYGAFTGPLTATHGGAAIAGVAEDIPSEVGCGILSDPLQDSAGVTAHEMGHMMGRHHAVDHLLPQVNCPKCLWQGYCGERADPPAPNFPYFYITDGNGTIPAIGPMLIGPDALIYGVTPDPPPFSVQSPFFSSELMGYCDSKAAWKTSKFTYEGVLSALDALALPAELFGATQVAGTPGPPGPGPDGADTYLLVRAFVNLDSGQPTWAPFRSIILTNPPANPTPGDYTLELLDTNDAVINSLSFGMNAPQDAATNESGFAFPILLTPDVRQARLKWNGAVTGVKVASANAPTVQVVSPPSGDVLTNDTVAVTWNGNDADADALAFNVFYSYNGGQNWNMVAMDIRTNVLSLHRSSLRASTNALFRVSVSDGFWSAEDTSAPFTVANNAPRLSIISPTNGTPYLGQQPIFLRAVGYDPEDGSGLTNITWTSSLDGLLGAGTVLESSADKLSQGVHIITAVVTDSGGASAVATITITIVSAPTIIAQPSSLTNNPGTTALFSIAASGTVPLSYQWMKDGVNLSDGGNLSGAATANLTLNNVGALDQGAYSAVVTNLYGRATSSVATLSVNLPPTITAQPQSLLAGSIANFTVGVSGTAPFSYQWFKDGAPLADGNRVTGATTATLLLNRVQLADAGAYTVVVSNALGTATSAPATLSVLAVSQEAYVKASNTAKFDEFGYAVAISGDTMVVGADEQADGEGAAYVFVRNGNVWAQQAFLQPTNADDNNQFGFSVAISGDTVVVGYPYENSDATGVNGTGNPFGAGSSGAAYVYVRNGTNWNQQAYLKASNTRAFAQLGYSVAVSGDTVVVGANQEPSNATGVNSNQNNTTASDAGAAYVFVRNGTNWSQQAYLKASNTAANQNFGWSVGVSDDTILVGAYQENSSATGVNGDGSNNNATHAGAAYVFVRSGTNWSQQAYLKASNTDANDQFGYSVAVSGDTALVGAIGEASSAIGVNGDQTDNSASDAGAAYVFARNGTNWAQQAYFKPSNTEASFEFGFSVALSGDSAIVGAPSESSNATGVSGDGSNASSLSSGAAYLFVRRGTNWSQPTYLKASNTDPDDRFGCSVAVSGNTFVAGALWEDSNTTGINGNQSDNSARDSGAAYVLTQSLAASFASPAWINIGFQTKVLGESGYNYIIQASTDLLTWLSLQTNSAPFTFTDTNAVTYPVRFYRAVLLP
jgi:hypothetical protein